MNLLEIGLTALFVNNFVVGRFLGLEPIVGSVRSPRDAGVFGALVVGAMIIVSAAGWFLDAAVLTPLHLEEARLTLMVLVIAAITLLLDMTLPAVWRAGHAAFGRFLPSLAANSALVGMVLLTAGPHAAGGKTLIEALTEGAAAGVGIALVTLIFSGLRARIELTGVARPLQGIPIQLIALSLVALGFMGFAGMHFVR